MWRITVVGYAVIRHEFFPQQISPFELVLAVAFSPDEDDTLGGTRAKGGGGGRGSRRSRDAVYDRKSRFFSHATAQRIHSFVFKDDLVLSRLERAAEGSKCVDDKIAGNEISVGLDERVFFVIGQKATQLLQPGPLSDVVEKSKPSSYRSAFDVLGESGQGIDAVTEIALLLSLS